MGKECENICVSCECSPNGDLCIGGILIIEWIGWSVSTSQPLAPITPLIAHWLMNKVARWQGWRFLHGFSNMDFCSPKPSWLQPLLRTQYIYSRDQHWDLALFPGVISQPPHGSWITLDYFHHGKDNALFLLKHTCSGYRFVFPAYNSSSKTTIWGFPDCLSTIMVCHTALPLTKELTSQQMKNSIVPTFTEFTGLTMFPNVLKQLAW